MSSLMFCRPVILQFLIAAIFFVTDYKKLKLVTSSFNFWTFGIYGYIFYGLTHMQMSKNVNNNVTMNPPIKRAPQLPYEKGKIWVFNS